MKKKRLLAHTKAGWIWVEPISRRQFVKRYGKIKSKMKFATKFYQEVSDDLLKQ
jgi:hypothetical protein